jgi:hypothetical protein
MLRINKEEKCYTIDLNESPYEEQTFHIESVENGTVFLPWGIEFVSSDKISANIKNRGELTVFVDVEALITEEYFVIRNYRSERIKVFIKPNAESIRPKEYKFKITKKIIDGRNVKVKILSKETSYEIPWKCVYFGKPLSYEITPSSSDKSEYVEIKPTGEIYNEIIVQIIFRQDKSGNEITLLLKQTNDSVEVIKAG